MRSICTLAVTLLTTAMDVASGDDAETTLSYRRFDVVEKDGKVAVIEPVRSEVVPLWAKDVSQEKPDETRIDPTTPWFREPIPFVVPPKEGSNEPFFPHNHCPSIAWLPNGDLLAIWFSTTREEGVEMTILGSRLRTGATAWDPASEFFKAARRNMTGSSLYYDQATGILHHLNGMGRENAEGWENLALLHRTSRDNGVTWSVARPVSSGANYQRRHQVIAGMVRTQSGTLIQACDATPGGQGPTAIHISRDAGRSWADPGGDIRGIHAGLVELSGGRLLAYGRGQAIDGRMPMSVSADMGVSWEVSAGVFPPIDSAQRLVLMRLREGPLLLLSFTGARTGTPGMIFSDAEGYEFKGCGLFGAVSYDEGKNWPKRRLLTPGAALYDVGAHFGAKLRRPPVLRTTPAQAEAEGYLAATQTPDGGIHLVSSKLHYRFNLKWIETPAPHYSGKLKTSDSENVGKPPDPVGNPASPVMLAGAWVPEDTRLIDFGKLPRVPSRHAVVNTVGKSGGVNQHNYLTHYQGKFWCMWSDGPGVEDRVGQRVKFATSDDGLKWSTPQFLTPVPPDSGPGSPLYNTRNPQGFRYISRGFWQRDGELLALASLDEAGDFFGKSLELHGFRLNASENEWEPAGVICPNAINNFPPLKLRTGDWMMSRRTHDYKEAGVQFLVGGAKAIDRWESYPVQGSSSELKAEEPDWWILPDQNLMAVFRDNRRSGFVYRAFSTDDGRTWSTPVKTNFPDAGSKMSGLRLSDGRYALVSNPNPAARDPLVLSISDDGMVFTKMCYLAGGRQVDYPHVIEREGHLYIAFAGAKSSVEVLKVRIADVDGVKMWK